MPGDDPTRSGSSETSWPAAALLGLAVGVVALLTTVMLLALPLFGVASMIEPRRATGRPFFDRALTGVVLPASALVGAAVAVGVARWRRRGGRLPGSGSASR